MRFRQLSLRSKQETTLQISLLVCKLTVAQAGDKHKTVERRVQKHKARCSGREMEEEGENRVLEGKPKCRIPRKDGAVEL